MNLSVAGINRKSGGRMRIDVRQLWVDSRAILSTFDKYALIVAVVNGAAFVVLLGMNEFLALALSLATYAGVALVRPHPAVPAPAPPEPISDDEAAFQQARASTAHVLEQAELIGNPRVQEGVRGVAAKFGKMLDVMQKDRDFKDAPEYDTKVVGPFASMLDKYVLLLDRGVDLASPQLAYFEQVEVPRIDSASDVLYQRYHETHVLDLAALLELHRIIIDSLDTEETDFEDAEADELDDDAFTGEGEFGDALRDRDTQGESER